MYLRYSLVLMVTHACDLDCSYCYCGAKTERVMPRAVGQRAIDRAVASVVPDGTLELGFFGGEPMLEAPLIESFIVYALRRAASRQVALAPGLTTNGTVVTPEAWQLMLDPSLALAISHDGLPQIHDRHRRFADGTGTSDVVLRTLRALLDAGRDLSVVMVVRPDTLAALPDGIAFLLDNGVRQVEPSLDLWARWTRADVERLESVIAHCAELWRERLPALAVSWFDEKAAYLTGTPISLTARCGFGCGEVAVAPSGRLYPCERLIGEDAEDNPSRLPGHVLEGDDFLGFTPPSCRRDPACERCDIAPFCNTTCRCSNRVRTGDVARPDGLLCRWNRACFRETARVLQQLAPRERGAPRP